jgi:hypothetical protein
MSWSVLCSGLVALFLVYFVERDIYNDQAVRNRINCELVNNDRKSARDQLDMQADNILGDNTKDDGDPDEDIFPINFDGTSFEEFKPLIISQARLNRERSRSFSERIVNCKHIFPDRRVIPIIG